LMGPTRIKKITSTKFLMLSESYDIDILNFKTTNPLNRTNQLVRSYKTLVTII
jgi:hypothetical protein